MEQKSMTIPEVLKATMNQLNAIQVPVGLMDQIGRPVAAAARNIQACLEAMAKADAAAREEDGTEEQAPMGPAE